MNLLFPTNLNATAPQAATPQGGGKAPDGFALLMQAIVKGPAGLLSVVSEGQSPAPRNAAAPLLAALAGNSDGEPTLAIVQPTGDTDEQLVAGDVTVAVDPAALSVQMPAESSLPKQPVAQQAAAQTALPAMNAGEVVQAAQTDTGRTQLPNAVQTIQVKASPANTVSQPAPVPSAQPAAVTTSPATAVPVQPKDAVKVGPTAPALPDASIEPGEQITRTTPPQVAVVAKAAQNITTSTRPETSRPAAQPEATPQTVLAKTAVPIGPNVSSPAPQAVADSPVTTTQTAATSAVTAAILPEVAPSEANADPRRVTLKSRLAQIKTESAVPSSVASSKSTATPPIPQAEQESLTLADQPRPETVKVSDAAKPTFLTEQSAAKGANPVGNMPALEDTPEIGTARPAEVLVMPRAEVSAAASVSRVEDATPKAPPKPFAEALISQVKSVDVSQNRTVVNLHPRGLGTIEVEVIGEKDMASKVVVRVENPAVLHALREERQLLAQTIGVADSSVFEFRENNTGAQSDKGQQNGAQSGGIFEVSGTDDASREHRDIVDHGQLDILT